LANDTSGDYLIQALGKEGHRLFERALLPDDRYQLRALISRWIAEPEVDGILVTGGTGFTSRDSTPEALLPLLDKQMPGFGELFRAVSVEDIGTSSLQSRAFAGLANATFVFGQAPPRRAPLRGPGLSASNSTRVQGRAIWRRSSRGCDSRDDQEGALTPHSPPPRAQSARRSPAPETDARACRRGRSDRSSAARAGW